MCRSCALSGFRGTRKLLTRKEKRANVAKRNNSGHALALRTSAESCRRRGTSNAEFADLFLRVQGRESEAALIFRVRVERTRWTAWRIRSCVAPFRHAWFLDRRCHCGSKGRLARSSGRRSERLTAGDGIQRPTIPLVDAEKRASGRRRRHTLSFLTSCHAVARW